MEISMFNEVVPREMIEEVLSEQGIVTQRTRKLNMVVTVMVLIGLNLWSHLSMKNVICKMMNGLRLVWGDGEYRVPGSSALCNRRYQIGAKPLHQLFRRVCRPIATEESKGAFMYGLRVMAIDGSSENVSDTPANAKQFGRWDNGRARSAFPQVKAVYLAECGTHAIVDAGFWPCHTSERVGARRLLRSITDGMLVTWDRGLHEYDMFASVVAKGSHVLSRLPAHVKPERISRLADGSWLAWIRPSNSKRRTRGERLKVRIIEYRIKDPALDPTGHVHRLITTLLDPVLYPALELVCGYHERWEIELVIDEIDTHQRLSQRTLRSLKPVGVIQELYALLIAHFIVRWFIHQAALHCDTDPDRLSFTDSLELLKDAFADFQRVSASQRPRIVSRLLRDISGAARIPKRRLRINPRVVKQKMSKFLKKRPEHLAWPQPQQPFQHAVVFVK